MKIFAAAILAACMTTSAFADPVNLRLGHAVFEAHPNHDTAVRFKEAVERLSNGDVTVEIFPARLLGDVKELMEGVQLGTIDMTVNSSTALATLEPSMNAFQLPFVIPGYEGFAKLSISKSARAIMDTLDKHGIIALGLYDGGQRHFLSVGDPVQSMGDLRGLKTRVPPAKLFVDVWDAIGVNPTPLNYGEVYSALEAGVLDGVEINLTSIESEKFYEVGGGVTLTGHYFWPSFLLINKERFDGLTEEQQAAIRQAASEIVEPQVMAVKALDEQVKKNLAERNIPVIEPSDEMMAAFTEAVAPVIESYSKDPLVKDFVAEANTVKSNM